MNEFLTLPAGPVAEASLATVLETVSAPVADHSIRTFLFARLIATQNGSLSDAAYDEDVLFAACVLHDLGLGDRAAGEARFEVEGADLAAEFLAGQGLAADDIDRVWEAIALHSSHGIAVRRGLISSLTYRGIVMDAGSPIDTLPAGQREQVLAAYPKPAGDRSIPDAIIKHAARSAAAAPPYSISADLLRQARSGA
jgi:HD superfamily phosphodiesterase